MKIATWNVNSIRVRLPQVLAWLMQEQPDILCLQETKITDEEFPAAAFRDAGYLSIYAGQKTYNGVATICRKPAEEIVASLSGAGTAQKRFLAASIDGVRVVNVYVPNGEEVGSEKYNFKLVWLEALENFLKGELRVYSKLVLLGDFNIAPEPRDVHDPQVWEGHVLFSEKERAAFQRLIQGGLVDVFRQFDQPPMSFSWWDYRAGAFRRNNGLRIDHMLSSPALAAKCQACRIDRVPRSHVRPSDHAPVFAEFHQAPQPS
ncbi:MAG: exodeoxyribonuclease III [Sulfuricaulis sp.]|uniref:exodeoxyribonuclease III n=1 Tax=Sulfuricaulis sp. TaxID=2003553 RepID=UPI0034A187EB